MGRLLERIVVFIIVLALLVAALQLVLGVLHRLTLAGAQVLAGVLRSAFETLLLGAFTIGVFVRVSDWLRGRNPNLARTLALQHERARLAVRRPADDTPVYEDPGADVVDEDPALLVDREEA